MRDAEAADGVRAHAVSRRSFVIGAGAAAAAVPVLGAAATPAYAAGFEDVLTNTFTSYSALESAWNYLYPWGSDHNGSARMFASPTDHSHVSLAGGVLTLTATRLASPESKSTSDPFLPTWYHSGTINTKVKVSITDQFPQWEVKGDFQAPTAPGTWPAFWLTAVNGWPPESDILEFKGTSSNLFNSFQTPTDVQSTIVPVANAASTWHTYRTWIEKVNARDVDFHYYLDGQWQATHRMLDYVGKPMHCIINLQMEGSSGPNGPGGTTTYRARNVYIGRNRAF
ncbi:family 16 glycosylhydrolase [Rathayibacter sp. VKM Ac-2760]|uniref:family 16 glycosylhydrolase n=1 Tax=Rathayibacter sp. VKM Ac-2760 TaxID=2609253 RepID=UPI001317F1E6|nr:family 16 glycosylhydrolase [Rathayibacter sp. VKM Ac-2760]QHC60039.1 family 16 glycosylhydrolase [Rathayibacter sp. VKM Ac-2760]